jgi:hypothetical protein
MKTGNLLSFQGSLKFFWEEKFNKKEINSMNSCVDCREDNELVVKGCQIYWRNLKCCKNLKKIVETFFRRN